jgi:hypothetical protein
MRERPHRFARIGTALALLLVVAGCTKAGQFDPTEVFSSDVFDTKKKLQGQREPVFPQGVPGTTSGVPAELVKGYQAPPEPTEAEAPPPEEKPKPKPKPKIVARPKQAPTQITVGRAPAQDGSAPAQSPSQQSPSQQSPWPAASQGAPAQQAPASSQSAWPSPQQAAQQPPQQSAWPNPPAPATSTH